VSSSGIVNSVIRITGIGDRDPPEWLIRISGIRTMIARLRANNVLLSDRGAGTAQGHDALAELDTGFWIGCGGECQTFDEMAAKRPQTAVSDAKLGISIRCRRKFNT
jgi:hypothetical protein